MVRLTKQELVEKNAELQEALHEEIKRNNETMSTLNGTLQYLRTLTMDQNKALMCYESTLLVLSGRLLDSRKQGSYTGPAVANIPSANNNGENKNIN
tara:strand:- start:166 stop:456 length:291 start_codon:yes stop_codon:yes gene_type:complete